MVTDNFNNFVWNDGQIATEIKTYIFCSKFLPVTNSIHTVVMVSVTKEIPLFLKGALAV